MLLLTRRDCTLCAEAEAIVEQACAEAGTSARITDVDSDEKLRARFTDHVPVLFVDQRLHGYWFVDAAKLRGALALPSRPMDADWQPDGDPIQGVS